MTGIELLAASNAAIDRSEANLMERGYVPTHALAIMQGGRLIADNDNARESMDAASLNKLAVVHALGERNISLDTRLRLEETDRSPGNGLLQYFPEGFRFELGDAVNAALARSDNTATRAIVRTLGGPNEVNDLLFYGTSPIRVGLHITGLNPKDPNDTSPEAPYYYGQTNAAEATLLMRSLMRDERFAPALRRGAFSGGLRAQLGEKLSSSDRFFDLVARGLTKFNAKAKHQPSEAFYLDALKRLPPMTTYPNKQGAVDGVRHDVAVIGNYTVAVLSTGHPELGTISRRAERAAYGAHAAIGKLIQRAD